MNNKMRLNDKKYLKQFLSRNSHNIYTSSILKEKDNYKGYLKIKLSGRIRGVSMAREFQMSSNSTIKRHKKEIKQTKKIFIKKRDKLNIVSNLIDKKGEKNIQSNYNNINTKIELAIKPQTLNSIGLYRLQYKNQDIYTKWGVFGIKLWLYNK